MEAIKKQSLQLWEDLNLGYALTGDYYHIGEVPFGDLNSLVKDLIDCTPDGLFLEMSFKRNSENNDTCDVIVSYLEVKMYQ